MESLPDEAIQQIFSTLSASDLLHAVCKSFGGREPRIHPLAVEGLLRFVVLLAL